MVAILYPRGSRASRIQGSLSSMRSFCARISMVSSANPTSRETSSQVKSPAMIKSEDVLRHPPPAVWMRCMASSTARCSTSLKHQNVLQRATIKRRCAMSRRGMMTAGNTSNFSCSSGVITSCRICAAHACLNHTHHCHAGA